MVSSEKKSVIKWIVICFFVIMTAAMISRYAYRIMLIQGDSMAPTFRNMQMVILDVHSRNFTAGDVVAFYCPGFDSVLVKRIVAGPQDGICISEGKLMVNGEISPYYKEAEFEFSGLLKTERRLDENEYIVIGDNISESKDSRYSEVGIVPGSAIIGKIP